MSATKDGGPAFPLPPVGTGDPRDGMAGGSHGMSLRDWFAANERIEPKETLGFAVLEALVGPRPPGNYDTDSVEWFHWGNKVRAAVRYARADAMLAAREGGAA